MTRIVDFKIIVVLSAMLVITGIIGFTGCAKTGTSSGSGTITKTTPTITWPTPTAITYGTVLGATQLDATASVAGTFTYSPLAGTMPLAGSQTLSVTFVPTDTTDYNNASASVPLTVNKATPALTLPPPAALTYPTPISSTQLDAAAVGVDGKSLAGTFAYTATSQTTSGGAQAITVGAVLPADTYTETATFTATDSNDYITTSTVTATLTVVCGAPVLTSITPPAWWSHGGFLGIVPNTINGACFQAGDQSVQVFGQGTSTITLPSGANPNKISELAGLGSNLTVPMAVKTTEVRASGSPVSNAIYWLSLGDQNLGAFKSDGTWVHEGANTVTQVKSIYQYDASGKLLGSCQGSNGSDIAVDLSNGNIGNSGGVVTMTPDGNGQCTIVTFMGSDGLDPTVSSSVMLNGRYCTTRPVAGVVSCMAENQKSGTLPTPTNAAALAKVCGAPWSSVATTIAGRDTMIVFCREKTATTTTPSLVQVDMATMAIGTVVQLPNISTYATMSAASTATNGWSTAGGWPMAVLNNMGIIAIGSTYDNVLDFFNVSTLTSAGISTVTVPANTYRIANDELNDKFVAAVGHPQAPVTTLLSIDPMTGATKTPVASVPSQILGSFLVSNGVVLGADLTGQAYVLSQQ
jgi:hypothetical protein